MFSQPSFCAQSGDASVLCRRSNVTITTAVGELKALRLVSSGTSLQQRCCSLRQLCPYEPVLRPECTYTQTADKSSPSSLTGTTHLSSICQPEEQRIQTFEFEQVVPCPNYALMSPFFDLSVRTYIQTAAEFLFLSDWPNPPLFNLSTRAVCIQTFETEYRNTAVRRISL